MYKLFIAATLITSAVANQYVGESYGGESYEAPKSYEENYKPEANKEEYISYEPAEDKPKDKEEPCATGENGIHDVIVGGEAGLIFTPSSILANVGDTVRFHFLMKNHTLTQSTFDKPCVKKPDGIDSGFKPSNLKSASEKDAPIFEYKVESKDEPTWWYCRQRTGSHCGKGMVFAINPNKEKTFEKFKEFAQQQNGTAEAGNPPAYDKGKDDKGKDYSQAPPPAWQPGYNTGSADACNCQCVCSVSSFRADSGQGYGMTGGMPAYAPAPWSSPSEESSGSGY